MSDPAQWANPSAQNIIEMKNQYENVNIFIVDWSGIAKNDDNFITNVFKRDYLYKSAYTKDLGQMLSKFLHRLVELEFLTNEKIYVVGHSLGAQTGGSLGRNFLERTGDHINNIVSLDAAQPNFDSSEFSLRAAPSLRPYACLR